MTHLGDGFEKRSRGGHIEGLDERIGLGGELLLNVLVLVVLHIDKYGERRGWYAGCSGPSRTRGRADPNLG